MERGRDSQGHRLVLERFERLDMRGLKITAHIFSWGLLLVLQLKLVSAQETTVSGTTSAISDTTTETTLSLARGPSELKTSPKSRSRVSDGFEPPKDDEKKKEEKKEGAEEAVKGTTVNGQQLYKQTINGKEYQYYYSTGEEGSQFVSQMQRDGTFKQTTMDAMLGRGAENGMTPIGSIETANGKLAAMYTMDGAPGSKAFFDGESWHIQLSLIHI